MGGHLIRDSGEGSTWVLASGRLLALDGFLRGIISILFMGSAGTTISITGITAGIINHIIHIIIIRIQEGHIAISGRAVANIPTAETGRAEAISPAIEILPVPEFAAQGRDRTRQLTAVHGPVRTALGAYPPPGLPGEVMSMPHHGQFRPKEYRQEEQLRAEQAGLR